MKPERDIVRSAKRAESAKDMAQAAQLWQDVLRLADSADLRAQAYAGMARVLRRQKRFDDMHELLVRAAHDVSDHAHLELERAHYHHAMQQWDSAIGHYAKALAFTRGRIGASGFCNYAAALRRTDRLDDARAILEEGLSVHPGVLELHQGLAEVELRARRWPEFMFHCRTMIHLSEDPGSSRAASRKAVPLLYSATKHFMRETEERRDRTGVTACLIVKDEAPYLLEWVSYYQMLGFDRILVYDNGSTDETRPMLTALQKAGQLTWLNWPDVPLQRSQYSAYDDALLRAETEWIGFFDIDEFLVLKRHTSIGAFVNAFPDDAGAVSINWRIFGSSGLERYEDRPVIERFVRCAAEPDRQVKSLGRVHAVRGRNSAHLFDLEDGFRYLNSRGEPYERGQRVFDVAQVNHYALRSREEFALKDTKGGIHLPAGNEKNRSRGGATYWSWFDANEEQDLAAYRLRDDVARRMAVLRAMIS